LPRETCSPGENGSAVRPIQQTKAHPSMRKRWARIVERSGFPPEDPLVRRQSPRHTVDTHRVVKVVIDPDCVKPRNPGTILCWVLNLSREGVMLRSDVEIRPRTRLTIEWSEDDQVLTLPGVVRQCTQTVGAFKVGIELRIP
jgi:hypothetical protein